MAQIDDLRNDYADILGTLERELAMRHRVLRGPDANRKIAEIDRAIEALRRLGAAIRVQEEAKQLALIPEDKPYV